MKKFAEILAESADREAADVIAKHHGAEAKGAGVGYHTVSHKAERGFFDHHGAHEPLKKAGWKLHKAIVGSTEGGEYKKGLQKVKVVSRHNKLQNTIVHSISVLKEEVLDESKAQHATHADHYLAKAGDEEKGTFEYHDCMAKHRAHKSKVAIRSDEHMEKAKAHRAEADKLA